MVGCVKHLKITSLCRYLKFKEAMNMSEKVERLGRGLQRVEVSSYGRENSQESNALPDFFFFITKRGT